MLVDVSTLPPPLRVVIFQMDSAGDSWGGDLAGGLLTARRSRDRGAGLLVQAKIFVLQHLFFNLLGPLAFRGVPNYRSCILPCS